MNEVSHEIIEDPLRANEEHSLPPDQEVPPAVAEEPAPVSAEEQQVCIETYRSRMIGHPDPMLASLGCHNGGLLLIGLQLEGAILESLASGGDTDGRLSKVLPALDSHLRLSRQVERFTQLALRTV